MSYLDVYIGDLDDPSFDWEGGDWSGKLPVRQSNFFPAGNQDFKTLVARIQSGRYDGKQVDWGGWVARLFPSEIMSFLDEQYTPLKLKRCGCKKQVDSIRQYILKLDPNKKYALVASEF